MSGVDFLRDCVNYSSKCIPDITVREGLVFVERTERSKIFRKHSMRIVSSLTDSSLFVNSSLKTGLSFW